MQICSELTPEMERQCYRAARRFWRFSMIWYGRGYSFDDVLQDARIIAIMPRGKKEPQNDVELFYKIYYGLLDNARTMTKSRSIKRRGGTFITYASWERLQEYRGGYLGESALQKSRESDEDKWIFRTLNKDGSVDRVFGPDQVKEAACAVAKKFDDLTIQCVELHFVHGLKYDEIGVVIGRTVSRISQILAVFKKELKKELLKRSRNNVA